MSLEIPTWDKIIGALGSTTSEIGGAWANLISDYYNGVDIGLLDPSKKPIIGTLTRYKFEKLGIFDNDQSHYIAFSADDIDTGGTRKVKFRRMNSPYEEDYAVLEGLSQELYNKTLNFANNTISNIPGSAIQDDSITNIKIKSDAAISTSKLADSANFALKNAANVFTAVQTIQVNTAIPLIIDRPTATATASNAVDYTMRNNNASPETIVYGRQNVILTDPTDGSEDSEYRISVMVAGSLTDAISILNNIAKFGGGTKQMVFNPTLLTNTRTYNPPNQSGVLALQDNHSRVGAYIPALEGGLSEGGIGVLKGLVGIGTKSSSAGYSTAGKYDTWSTRAVTNDLAGVVKLDSFVFARLSNPLVRFIWRFTASSTRRMFKGMTTKQLITNNTNTEPLASGQSGFMIGYGAGDTQFYLFHNDSTGTCQKTATGINLPVSDTNLIADIQFIDSPASMVVTIWNATIGGEKSTLFGGPVTQTTDIPANTTQLYLQDLVGTSDGSIQGNIINKVEVYA